MFFRVVVDNEHLPITCVANLTESEEYYVNSLCGEYRESVGCCGESQCQNAGVTIVSVTPCAETEVLEVNRRILDAAVEWDTRPACTICNMETCEEVFECDVYSCEFTFHPSCKKESKE
jgi:hypothetical protein